MRSHLTFAYLRTKLATASAIKTDKSSVRCGDWADAVFSFDDVAFPQQIEA
jgi:hypothetical protein